MSRAASTVRRTCTTAGIAGIAAGCAGMAAMLPGAAAGALGALGIGGSSVLERTLSPVALPLYVASAVLVVLGALACSRLVALLAISGSLLLYLSMFELARGGNDSTSMATMQQHDASGSPQAEPFSFYVGLALLAAGLGLGVWRRHRHRCRAIVRLPHPLPLER